MNVVHTEIKELSLYFDLIPFFGTFFIFRGELFDPQGDFLQRYEQYCKGAEQIRAKLWLERGRDRPWKKLKARTTKLSKMNENHWEQLSNISGVTRLFLKWSDSGLSNNLLINEYHDWAADKRMCEVMLNCTGNWNRQRSCNSDKASIIPSKGIQEDFLHPQAMIHVKDRNFPEHIGLPEYITYILFIQDTVITKSFLFSGNIRMQIEDKTKTKIIIKAPHMYNDEVLYDEVMVVAHLWPKNVYHAAIDGILRLIPYLQMLKSHPQIRIHVGLKSSFIIEMLALLGITEDRLVTGDIRAKMAYIPEPDYNWFIHVPNVQLLSYTYRHLTYIKDSYQKRKSLVHIVRTRKRLFEKLDEVKDMLKKITNQYGLLYEEFLDTDLPSLKETLKMYDRAVLVFAPHGAGLFNMIFCRPGTFIIEVLCPDHPTLSLLRLAHSLGHRYYAFASDNSETNRCRQGIKVDIPELRKVLQFYVSAALMLIDQH